MTFLLPLGIKGLKFLLYVLTFTFIRMEIVHKDVKVGYVSGFQYVFQYAVKNVLYFFHVSFLETFKATDFAWKD